METRINIDGMYGILTNEHAASSYGQPVLIIEDDGRAPAHLLGDFYCPDDLLSWDTDLAMRGEWGTTARQAVANATHCNGPRKLIEIFVRSST